MQRGAIYIRVSTDDQTEFSPAAQRKTLLDYAKKNNIYIDESHIFVDEGISGRKATKRPSFMKMISIAKTKPTPFDIILVHKFDRFARNREDSVVYKSLLRKECNIKVVSITENIEDDKFSVILEAMLEAMAEYYSLNLADEVKKGMFEKASRGEHIGKAPYGYDLVDKKLVPNKEEFIILKQIYSLYVSKDYTLSSITKYLNANNLKTKNGGIWRKITVKYILNNHIYAGYTRYNYRKGGTGTPNDEAEWILVKSTHESAIDEQTFAKAQKKMKLNSQLSRRDYNQHNVKSWLQRLAKCTCCGATLTISTSHKKKYTCFRCAKSLIGACDVKCTISTKKLERLILETIKRNINSAEALVIEKIKTDEDMQELDMLNNELFKIKDKYELIKNAYLARIDTIQEYKINKEKLQEQEELLLTKIEQNVSSRQESPYQSKLKLKSFYNLLNDDSLSIMEKNKVAKQFIKEVQVDLINKQHRIIYFSY